MTVTAARLAKARRIGARHRFERLVLTAVGFATTGFMFLLLGGTGGIKIQTQQLASWYGVPMLVVAFGLPVLLAVLAWVAPRPVVHWLAIGTPIVFAIGMALFPLAVPGRHLIDDAPPWFNGIHALHGVIFGTAVRKHWLWLYAASHGVIIATVRVMVHSNDVRSAAVDGISATIYVLILMATTAGVVAAADRLDAAAAEARGKATLAVAAATREREETSINAMVHDDIMSVLLTASRPAPPPQLPEQAQAALVSIAKLEDGDTTQDMPADEVAQVLEATARRIVAEPEVAVDCASDLVVPAAVTIAMRDALAEAARNSMRHGGEATARSLTITADARGLTTRFADEGPGFNVRKVGARRLGIQLSILERMRMVQGGSATVDSRPGAGTTVTLRWEAAS